MPHSILKLREAGYVAKDMYKSDLTLVPTNAGMIVLFISYISIALLPLIVRLLNLFIPIEGEISDLSQINLAFLLVVSIYAFYGLIDDLVDIGRKLKLVFPIIFGYPLISLINPSFIWIPFYGDYNLDYVIFETITSGDIFRIIIIPIYIMVVANLVNMHSGYNGLQSGLSIIVISTLLFKSWLDGLELESLPAWAFLGSIMAFWFKNFYPAKVFEGNIGSLLFGSVIGCLIVIQEYWWFGFFILIPHTFNFVLWMIWLILMKINPEKYIEVDGEHKKFGEVGKDGSLIVPNTLTLKWIPNYYLNITERTSTLIMYSLTTIFCLTSIIIF
tara:strand:+ start:10898 stop:11887 length:990 start_codon:yes stop_codon:yes gene_type:complete